MTQNLHSHTPNLGMMLQLVLPRESLATGSTGEGLLPGVQELVPVDVLWSCEFFATYVTWISVVGIWTVGLHVLGQFTHLVEFFSTLK